MATLSTPGWSVRATDLSGTDVTASYASELRYLDGSRRAALAALGRIEAATYPALTIVLVPVEIDPTAMFPLLERADALAASVAA